MDRVVAITGGSSGIGRATAVRLGREGASVVLCARRKDRLDEAAAEVVQAGGQALAVAADVTSEGDMQRLVDAAAGRFGHLDAIVCNAGFGIYGAIDDIDADAMQKLLAVNFMGTFHAIRAALPVFRRRNRGHVIVVSSIVGRRAVTYMGAYAATKAAQVGLAESLRAELAGTGIHVTLVYPISTATEFFDVMTRESGTRTRAPGPRQDAGTVADAIARAIRRPVAEVFPYPAARGLVLLNTLAPGWTDRFVRRYGRKPVGDVRPHG